MTERTEIFVRLVESLAAIWHGCAIPSDRAAFAAFVLDSYMPENLRELSPYTAEEWQRERDEVARDITAAVDCVSQRSRWTN